jgi:flavin-binding protein dodecin
MEPTLMTIVKVAEILVESNHSWHDAMQKALLEASRTAENIQSISLQDDQTPANDGDTINYRVNAKISYKVNSNHQADS